MPKNDPLKDPLGRCLGRVIQAKRKAKGLSTAELGKAVGVDYTTITKYERGVVSPSPPTLYRLEKTLGPLWSPAVVNLDLEMK